MSNIAFSPKGSSTSLAFSTAWKNALPSVIPATPSSTGLLVAVAQIRECLTKEASAILSPKGGVEDGFPDCTSKPFIDLINIVGKA